MYRELYNSLIEGRSSDALSISAKLLREGVSVKVFYEDYLRRAITEMVPHSSAQNVPIWKEHEVSSIIRTIIENCAGFIDNEKKESNGKKAVVVCPKGETHEIGARMIADYYRLGGYETLFIGANTPHQDIVEIADSYLPDVIAVSVSANYNLISARKLISLLRESGFNGRIALGGSAAAGLHKTFGADEAEVI